MRKIANGGPCSRGDQCQSAICALYLDAPFALDNACGECLFDTDCAGGVCGLAYNEDNEFFYRSCVPPASAEPGAPCFSHLECADGYCASVLGPNDRACGECAEDADCAEDELCMTALVAGETYPKCERSRSRASGEACARGIECQSGDCSLFSCQD